MAIPHRGITSSTIYFVTSGTFCKTNTLQSDAMAELFCHTLFRYRDAKKFRVHSFVVMPNHFHLILTVAEGLEQFHTWCIGWSTASAVQVRIRAESASAAEVTKHYLRR